MSGYRKLANQQAGKQVPQGAASNEKSVDACAQCCGIKGKKK